MWQWAREYVLADNFFMGAFGGSYLNHLWLVCACAPRDADAPDTIRSKLGESGRLERRPDSPASALKGPPRFVLDGEATPDGYSVNTAQPPYQPSRIRPAPAGDPRFADVLSGDEHIAEVISKIKASPLWNKTAIIVTYDENGGFWDHVAPPKGDRWGPGSRIPTIVVSPWARKGYVDSTQYDTTSILKFITLRFELEPLPGARESMGDLTHAFDFPQR